MSFFFKPLSQGYFAIAVGADQYNRPMVRQNATVIHTFLSQFKEIRELLRHLRLEGPNLGRNVKILLKLSFILTKTAKTKKGN